MDEFLKSECPHCGQAIEYPAAGTGQTVPCPTCEEPFVLAPAVKPEPKVSLPPPPIPPAPTPATPAPVLKKSSPSLADRLDQAVREFAADREFAPSPPTREQVARAWAAAQYKKSSRSEPPSHPDLVAALRELFKEFRKRPTDPKPTMPENKFGLPKRRAKGR